ncbi:grpE protein homolog 2, mitochondrial [Anomaloglossus baeobatrachus]|uniref:grpE protein homolog 2, mitochondrial n=1 Tax=Anomaloglossus baeobatrachus TaxID=238106 RepID=UPI003F4F82BB
MAGGFRMRAVAEQLRRALTYGARRHSRCSVCAYSGAATQQRSSGSNTTSDGSGDKPYVARPLEKGCKLEEEVRDLTERYRKAMEDSEIVRSKTKKFVEDAKLFGIQSFSRDLVDVADLLEQAVEDAEQKGMQDVLETLSSIEKKLQGIFTKHGLLKMTPVGGDYDPYDHEVVCHVPAEGRRPGSVATIQQDGYKLHGRTIRHAQVGIAVKTQE